MLHRLPIEERLTTKELHCQDAVARPSRHVDHCMEIRFGSTGV
jgi:hypothetical protein